jgi:CheY-like chemotaxis protein
MSKKILLADDSLTIQKVVELTFSDSDVDLVCVSNGLRALEKVRDDRPDLVLADVVMPEKNGYEVCEAIKADPSTAWIPVVLLTGTFEPFDKHRAEKIGADAIVSKPFDSQQLVRQVEALLARSSPPSAATVAMRIPDEIARGGMPPEVRQEIEPEPFDAGFSPEDFTGSIRTNAGGDPFEEEYGRGDVDSAIEAFERARATAEPSAVPAEGRLPEASPFEEESESPAWLGEEMDRSPGPDRGHWMTAEIPPAPPLFEAPVLRADEAPTAEIPVSSWDRPTVADAAAAPAPAAPDDYEDITADAADVLFEIPPSPPEDSPEDVVFERSSAFASPGPAVDPMDSGVARPASPPGVLEAAASMVGGAATGSVPDGEDSRRPAPGPAETSPPPRELEELAQTKSIPELAEMLSSVSRGGEPLSEADIDRLAERVVEKLSDRVIREIAWEVIPDMAEIVIKQRIKELEAGVE